MHLSYPSIIKYARQKKKISLRELAESTFLSFQGLSKYEAGVVNISTESFILLSNVLEIDINSFNYVNNNLENDLNDLYEALVFMYDSQASNLYNKIITHIDYINLSDLYQKWSVYQFAYKIHFNLENEQDYIDKLSNINNYNISYLGLIYDYLAIYCLKNNKYNEAKQHIEQSLKYFHNDLVWGMLNYHAGMIYIKLGKFSSAFNHCKEAERIFLKEHNQFRLSSVQLSLAIIYAWRKDFEASKKIYKRLYKDAILREHLNSKLVSLYNLAWISYLEKKYVSTLQYLNEITNEIELNLNGLFILIQTYIEMNELDLAKNTLKSVPKKIDNKIFELKFKIQDMIINTSDKFEFFQCLNDYYTLCKKTSDFENILSSINLLIDYYKKELKYKKATVFLEEKIELIIHMNS